LRIRRIGRIGRIVRLQKYYDEPWNCFAFRESAAPKPAAHLAWPKNLFTTFLEPNKKTAKLFGVPPSPIQIRWAKRKMRPWADRRINKVKKTG